MTYLIADSGSTKTSWMLVEPDGQRTEFETTGINPVRDSQSRMEQVLASCPTPTQSQLRIYFYGAGCLPPYSDALRRLLAQRFPGADVHVDTDLLGAAHALCAGTEGIACILGTGSNSCLYDGHAIVQNVSPLGYILGDEGSGAVLGRNLLGDLLKGQMPPALLDAFLTETGLTRADIIERVYRQPQPNRFLASLVPFLGRHRTEAAIHRFLVDNFRRFFHRNVALYQRPDLPVHFTGGVAYSYSDELHEAARLEGFQVGRILQRPIGAMADYLQQEIRD